MILDERTEFADAVSVGTPNSTTVNVGDLIDLEVARDIGNGQTLYFVVQVTTAIASGGAAVIHFMLVSDSTSTVATDGTQTIHFFSEELAMADVDAAGDMFIFPIPLGFNAIAYEQFLGFQIRETAGQALNAGAVNAFLTLDPHGWVALPDASN